MTSAGDGSLPRGRGQGGEVFRGIYKTVEECGELLQELGKRMVCPVDEHWDEADKGSLDRRIEDEMGDVLAAIGYLSRFEPRLDIERIEARRVLKLALFTDWQLSGLGVTEVPR